MTDNISNSKRSAPICGVYGILNTVSSKTLVGSSVDIDTRWGVHRHHARKNTHNNPHFQRAWNKYGEDAFEFRVLEECPENMLLLREDAWMQYLDSLTTGRGYNMKNATRTVFTEELRSHISEALKGKPKTEEHKRSLSLANIGKTHGPEYKKAMSESCKNSAAVLAQCKKMAAANVGRPMPEKTRQALLKTHVGKPMPSRVKAALKEARLKKFLQPESVDE